MALPGSELYWDDSLTTLERWYCRIWGIPIIGLRIRLRWLDRHLPPVATRILDAGCGRGVISRMLTQRYPDAMIDAIDQNTVGQEINQQLAKKMGLKNCRFLVADLTHLDLAEEFDLIVSVDNLEHIEDDRGVLCRFFHAMRPDGVLVVHVPHYYRRWPVFKWTKNFDVPGHVRPGYHLPELIERVRSAGFEVQRIGFSYSFFENLANNISYAITSAEEKRKWLYAAAFPLLNLLACIDRWSNPHMGAGVWAIANKRHPNNRMPDSAEQKE
jgi:SAM-dependent methyltransferase